MKPWENCSEGIDNETTTKHYYKAFGIFKINTRFLQRNILIVKYKNCSGPINKLRRTDISSTMRIILTQLLNGNTTIDQVYYSTIPITEKAMLFFMLKGARLIDSTNYRELSKELPDQLREKFNVIRGEIEAGNNSDLLIHEAKDIIIAMMYTEMLSNKQYKMLMEEFE